MAGGSGPLVVFIHGFPDFWYTWRHQIEGLLATHSVAAMDTRGFNLSDAPDGVEKYAIQHLVDDVAAVIGNERRDAATIVGHDWGGVTAWAFAQAKRALTERLVIVNVAHPAALSAEMQRPKSAQQDAFAYVGDFRKKGSEKSLDANALADFLARDDISREVYAQAFERSNFEAMMNYYRQNPPGRVHNTAATPIEVPVLQFHGLDDPVLLADSLNGTWQHLAHTWTLVTIPGAGHWPHHDQPDLVTTTMRQWLNQPVPVLDQVTRSNSQADGCCG
jgi:pimeloyl-ACP methyl ester carboxylesterase